MAKAVATKAKINDLLSALDDAFAVAQDKNEALTEAHAAQSLAVADAQKLFESVKAQYQSKVQAAATEAEEARRVLEQAKQAVNDRIGTLTGSADSRVTVK